MDEPAAERLPTGLYRCPGQGYAIDRSAHLTRLASFYPGCLRCEHRHDAGGLSPLQLRHWQQVERRAPRGPRVDGESFSGTATDVDSDAVANAATALAASLFYERRSGSHVPAVLVGTDGNWATAELVPAACRALERGGCRVLEVGAVTSAAMAVAAAQTPAAAIWLGNASGAAHMANIKLWQAGGRPCSSPGQLDHVFSFYGEPPARQNRGAGVQRLNADAPYLPLLDGLFHALRPLVFVLDTTCQPLLRYWRKVSADAACQMSPLGKRLDAAVHAVDAPAPARSIDTVARQVREESAHFGAWIDGAGEACQFVDERGAEIAPGRVLLALAAYAAREQDGARIVLERAAPPDLQTQLERLGCRVFRSEPQREQMSRRMEETAAQLGGGPTGRFWFSGLSPMPDALLALCLLIRVASQSDRPLSEALDATSSGE